MSVRCGQFSSVHYEFHFPTIKYFHLNLTKGLIFAESSDLSRSVLVPGAAEEMEVASESMAAADNREEEESADEQGGESEEEGSTDCADEAPRPGHAVKGWKTHRRHGRVVTKLESMRYVRHVQPIAFSRDDNGVKAYQQLLSDDLLHMTGKPYYFYFICCFGAAVHTVTLFGSF